MLDNRMPKKILFGWLSQPRPKCGSKKRWRDAIQDDLKTIDVGEKGWYEAATTSRNAWRAICNLGYEDYICTQASQRATSRDYSVTCDACQRTFCREGDKKRYKCIQERMKPASQQRGAVHCTTCDRWFLSQGGFTVHVC